MHKACVNFPKKIMRNLVTCVILIGFLFSPRVFAAEVTYSAKLTGIECADCKRTISRAIGKIKGVKTIRIDKEGKNQHRLTVVTDGSNAISRADATAALGKDSHYAIVSWSTN